jgi:hypothetical protein
VPSVSLEISDYKEAMPQVGVWRYAITEYGAQYVMISGILLMLKLFAGSWVLKQVSVAVFVCFSLEFY